MRPVPSKRRHPGVSFQVEELEPRLLFSADAATLLGLPVTLDTRTESASTQLIPSPNASAVSVPVMQSVVAAPAPPAASQVRHELVFVDASVPEADKLIQGIQASATPDKLIDVVVIKAGEDGLAVITSTLQQRHDLDAVHIISHGDDLGLTLGSSRLDTAALNAHMGDISAWGQALSDEADLLLYGCDLAQNATGRALVDNLSLLTGADVAASTDKTGSSLLGGNWTLEYTDGVIDTSVAASASLQATWQGLLQSTVQGSETLVHTATNGGTSETTTTNRQVAMDSSGNYVVVWNDGTANLVFQRFNADGSPAGLKTNIATTGTPANPQVAMNASGAFVVVWSDSSGNLKFAKYTAAGVVSVAATTIASGSSVSSTGPFVTPPYNQTTITVSDATVGINTAGEFVVAYRSTTSVQTYFDPTHTSPSGSPVVTDPIMFKAYTSAGVLQGSNGTVTVSGTAAGNNSPSIAMNGTGNFVISWTDSSGNVYAHAYLASRLQVAAAADVTNGGGGSESSVGMDSSGNYVVAYQDAGVIKYRMYSSGAVATTGVLQANLNPAGTPPADSRTGPSVSMGTAGNFVIAWQNAGQDGNGNGVYYRQFYSNGASGLSDQRVATTTSGNQQMPSVAFDGTHAVVIWSGNGAQTGQIDNQGVYYQRYTITANTAPGAITMTGTTLSYTENATAIVDSGITLGADIDDDYLDTVTVAISGGFAEDVLAVTANSYGITGVYSAGTLTLSGPATIADYQAVLRANVTYTNTSDNPNTTTRTFTVTASDGAVGGAVSATRNMTVTAVNDAPAFTFTAGSMAFTENGVAAVIDAGMTVTDPDTTNLTGATVQITGNFVTGEDVLSYTTVSGITGSWNAATGILTLSGTTTAANYQAALRTVKYQNTSDNPGTSKTVTFAATDGSVTGSGTRGIAVTAVNDGPVNTVPAGQNVNEDTPLVFSSANGNALVFTDIDANSGSVQVQLTVTNGTLTLAGTSGLSFTVGSGTANTTMTFTGTLANVNVALNGLTFNPTANFSGSSTLTFATSDLGNTGGGAKTDSDTVAITIAAVNDAPAIVNTVAAQTFTEGGVAKVIDSGLTVADVDSASITGATVQITGNFVTGEDVLSYTTVSGVTGSWNAATGVLTLSGTTTAANYQAALRTVKYQNTSDNPGTSKTVTFSATDGSATGTSTRGITITAVNDAPTNTVPGAQSINEDATLVFSSGSGNLISIADIDANAGLMQVTVGVAHGTLSLSGTTGLSFSVGDGSLDASMTFTGTVANVNAALAGLSYFPTANYNGTDTLTLVTSDQGNTGGGALSDTDTVTINLAAVNDAPVATIVPATYSATEQVSLALQGTGLSISDVDVASGSMQATLSVTSGTLSVVLGSTGVTASGSGTSSLVLTGTLAQLNSLLAGNQSGTVTYIINTDTPPASDLLTLLVSDQGNTGSGGARTGSDTATINITAVNDAPVISSNGGGASASVSIAENTTAVTTVVASDPEGSALTYTIVAGGDGAKFTINASTGVLAFLAAPDYENPTDAGANNVYDLTVQVSDGSLVDTQAVAVTVTDVASTLIVTTTADTNDTGLGASFNAEALNASKGTDGKISLREAIIAANTTAGTDTISFAITGATGSYGEYTINVGSALPNLTGTVYINAATQTGYTNRPLVVLDGNGGSGDGLYLSNTADGSTVRGLVIRGFSGNGIYVQAASDNNTIVGNYIGSFNADGSNAGAAERNASEGIESYGANLTIGGTTVADRNVISGNASAYNIYLATGSDGTVIKGNYIGLNAAGTAAFSTTNSAYGVMIENAATNVTIGGSATGAGNVISGFTSRGVWVTTTGTTTLQGNYIGTDYTGTVDLGNTGYGLYVDDGGSAIIGGTAVGAGNLISGNDGGGIYVGSTGGATIQGNTVGLNAAGTAALGNTGVGIYLNTSNASTVGGNTAAARNIVSGNSTYGIQVVSSPATGHVIKGNYIGVGADGTSLLGNGSAGVYITGDNTTIGGKGTGDGNIIAGNGGAGIAVVGGISNLFYRNSIHSNTGLGIDLNNDGVTLNDYNDGDVGGNWLNNFPVITSVVTNGSSTTVQGSIEWYTQAQPIYIEFFSSPSKDASGYGQGKTYLGYVQVTTNASTGDATFSATLSGVTVGDWITAVANVEAGPMGASEFAMAVQAVAPVNAPRGKVIWNGSGRNFQNYADWSSAGFSGVGVNGLNFGDDISMIAAAEAPTRNEILFIGSANGTGAILAGIWNGSTWSSVLTLPVATPGSDAQVYDSFAIAYDSISGNAMLTWDNGNTGTTGLSYATWDGSTWSAIGTITAPVSGEPNNVRLVASPISHEMVLAVSTSATTNNQYAVVWNGSSWGNAQALGTNSNNTQFETNVVYEQLSGRAMVLYDASASNSAGVQYRLWNGSAWSAESTLAAPAGVTASSDLLTTVVASDPTSNRIALATQDEVNQVWLAVWDGSAWGSAQLATTVGSNNTEYHPGMSVAFESQSGDLLAVYGKDTGPNVFYRTWTSAVGWSGELTGPSMGGTDAPQSAKLYSDPYSNTIMLGVQDEGSDLNFVAWDGSAWGTVTQLDANTGHSYRESFTYVWYRDAPVVSNLVADTLAYTEGQAATVVDQGTAATVTLSNGYGYAGGNLTVSIPAGGTSSEDVLSLRNQGTGAGQIGLSGGNVTYAGLLIGTLTGGTGGVSLVITLNANATDAAVGALINNVTYQNTNTAMPSTTSRTVRFVVANAAGHGSDNADVTVTVAGVNDVPVNTVPAAQTTNEDTAKVFSSGNGNLISITDVDAGSGSMQVTISVLHGALTLSGITGLSFISGDGSSDASMTFTGTVTDINAALAGMSYLPTSNYNGADTLTIVTSDQGNTGTGGTLTDTDTV
ncbi:MAG: DUF4347 domain-containing protein, partial [Rubrivivax sp.]